MPGHPASRGGHTMNAKRKPPMLRGLYGDVAIPKAPRAVGPERFIQKACLDWLNTIPGVAVWRQNIGAGMFSNKTGPARFVRFGQKGEADLCGIGPGGIYISIEVKAPGNLLRPEQVLWLDMIRQHGGIAFGVNSLDSCVRQLREAFIQRGFGWRDTWNV
jgi:hypothetical protein